MALTSPSLIYCSFFRFALPSGLLTRGQQLLITPKSLVSFNRRFIYGGTLFVLSTSFWGHCYER